MMPVACPRAADTSDGYSSTIANYAKGDKDDTNEDAEAAELQARHSIPGKLQLTLRKLSDVWWWF